MDCIQHELLGCIRLLVSITNTTLPKKQMHSLMGTRYSETFSETVQRGKKVEKDALNRELRSLC